MEDYIEGRVHMNWRWNYNIGGGQLLDWVGHHVDIAHWGLDLDNTGPVEVEGSGEFPAKDAFWNTCTKYKFTAKYENGVEMTVAGGHDDIKGGTKFFGEKDAFVHVNRGYFMADAAHTEWRTRPLTEAERKIQLATGVDHWRNLVDCIKSRKPTVTPVTAAHRSATVGHLGLIAMMLGRKVKWDPVKEEIIGDAEATKLLSRPYRDGYSLEA
jgi:predicted dehydrogenase